jgi:hypothetical protein
MRLGTVRRPTRQGDLFLVHYGIYRKYNYVSSLWFIYLATLDSSLSNSTDDDAGFAHSSPRRLFLGVEKEPKSGQ